MNSILRVCVVAALMFCVGGCVIAVGNDGWKQDADWKARQERNRAATESLAMGRTRDSVVAELGQADFTEAFVRNGQTFDVLFYRTRLVDDDGRTTKDDATPIVFVGGALVGWGDTAVDEAAP